MRRINDARGPQVALRVDWGLTLEHEFEDPLAPSTPGVFDGWVRGESGDEEDPRVLCCLLCCCCCNVTAIVWQRATRRPQWWCGTRGGPTHDSAAAASPADGGACIGG